MPTPPNGDAARAAAGATSKAAAVARQQEAELGGEQRRKAIVAAFEAQGFKVMELESKLKDVPSGDFVPEAELEAAEAANRLNMANLVAEHEKQLEALRDSYEQSIAQLKQQQAEVAAAMATTACEADQAAEAEAAALVQRQASSAVAARESARENSAAERIVAFFRLVLVKKQGLEYTREFKLSEPLGVVIDKLQVEEVYEDSQAGKMQVKVGTFAVACNGESAYGSVGQWVSGSVSQ